MKRGREIEVFPIGDGTAWMRQKGLLVVMVFGDHEWKGSEVEGLTVGRMGLWCSATLHNPANVSEALTFHAFRLGAEKKGCGATREESERFAVECNQWFLAWGGGEGLS
jgi:hypothetical protein